MQLFARTSRPACAIAGIHLTIMHGGVALKRGKKAPDGSFVQRDWYIWYGHGGKRHVINSDLTGRPFRDYGPAEDAHGRAIKLLVAIDNEIQAGKHDPERYKPIHKNRYSVPNVIAAYFESRIKDIEHGRIGKMQLVEIRRSLGYFTAYLDENHIDDVRDVRAFHLQAHFNRLPKKKIKDEDGNWTAIPWKPKSVKNHQANIGAFVRWAWKMEYIPHVPAMPPMPVIPQGNIRFYIDEEQRAVLGAISAAHVPIFEFMSWCGCRPSEARALRVQDVDMKMGVILLQSAFNKSGELSTTKTKRARPLPIDDVVEPFITGAMRNRIAGFVFTNPATGNYYTEEELRYQWERAIKAAGARYLSMTEGTRKTVATRLINSGVEPQIISDILGNSPAILKRHYAQITASRYRGILGRSTQTVPKPPKADSK